MQCKKSAITVLQKFLCGNSFKRYLLNIRAVARMFKSNSRLFCPRGIAL
jgi:hypothetical protein